MVVITVVLGFNGQNLFHLRYILLEVMIKQMDLTSFDVYQYLKQNFFSGSDEPYMLVPGEVYRKAAVDFPIRNIFYGIVLTDSGGNVHIRVSSEEYFIKEKTLILLGQGIVSEWVLGSDTPTHTILFREPLLEGLVTPEFLASMPFFLPGGQHVIRLSDDEHAKLKSTFELMKRFEKEPDVMSGITFSLLTYIQKLYKAEALASRNYLSLKEKQVRQFRSLVARHFREEKSVQFYADKLNITPKYLSEFLLVQTGKSAKHIINSVIFLDAKSLLKQTSLSVQEISFQLGFPDASYFSKAFKKVVGITPLTYRKK